MSPLASALGDGSEPSGWSETVRNGLNDLVGLGEPDERPPDELVAFTQLREFQCHDRSDLLALWEVDEQAVVVDPDDPVERPGLVDALPSRLIGLALPEVGDQPFRRTRVLLLLPDFLSTLVVLYHRVE